MVGDEKECAEGPPTLVSLRAPERERMRFIRLRAWMQAFLLI